MVVSHGGRVAGVAETHPDVTREQAELLVPGQLVRYRGRNQFLARVLEPVKKGWSGVTVEAVDAGHWSPMWDNPAYLAWHDFDSIPI